MPKIRKGKPPIGQTRVDWRTSKRVRPPKPLKTRPPATEEQKEAGRRANIISRILRRAGRGIEIPFEVRETMGKYTSRKLTESDAQAFREKYKWYLWDLFNTHVGRNERATYPVLFKELEREIKALKRAQAKIKPPKDVLRYVKVERKALNLAKLIQNTLIERKAPPNPVVEAFVESWRKGITPELAGMIPFPEDVTLTRTVGIKVVISPEVADRCLEELKRVARKLGI